MNTTTFLLGGCIKHRGLPIANVELTLMRAANRFAGTKAEALASMLTSSSGEYRFTVEAGEYFLYVKPDQSTRFVSFRTDSVFVNGNTKLDVLLELGRVWTGKFISASAQIEDGYNYELKLCNDQDELMSAKPLQLGKSFEMVLELSPYKATVVRHNDNGASLIIWDQNLAAQNDIRLDIVLPDLFKLSGKVIDDQGIPLKQARVTVLKADCLKRATTEIPIAESILTTDSEGHFSGVLPEGYYVAMVEAPDMAADLVPIKLQSDTEIEISMTVGLKANGQVLLKGTPVNSLKLLITGVNQQFLLPAAVDDQGKFDVCVPPGSYEFRIGGLEHTWMPPDVPEKTSVSEASLQAVGVMTASDADSAAIDGGATTAAISEDILEAAGGNLATGSVSPMSAPASDLQLATDKQAVKNISRVLAPWVRLIDVANNLDGNIKLQDGYIVEFEVVDQNEHAITNCIVDCRLYEAERDSGVPQPPPDRTAPAQYGIISRVLTDATGRCRLTLGAGIYTLDFIPTEQSQAEYKQIRQLSINGNLRRKMRLTVAGTAEIIAMDTTAAGKTPAGVGVD